MYDQSIEHIVASILYHYPAYLDLGVVDDSDFFTEVKAPVQAMLALHATKAGLINAKSVGTDFPLPSHDEVAQFDAYVAALKSLNGARKLQDLPKRITRIVTDDTSYEAKLTKITKLVESHHITKGDVKDHLITEHIDQYASDLYNVKETNHVPSGITLLDRALQGGFENGEYVTIAGDTGDFKSTTMYNIMLYNALIGNRVAIFTYEIPKRKVIEIFVSMLAGIDSIFLKSRQVQGLDGTNRDRITAALATLKQLPIYIFDNSPWLADIRMICMKCKPQIVGVDYLQLVPDYTSASAHQRVGALESTTHQLKQLAMQLNIPVLGLSQFSRPADKGDKDNIKRGLYDLKGASCLTYDTEILLANGTWIKIGDLVANGIKSADVVTRLSYRKLGVRKMINAFATGRRKVYELTLNSGRSIKATGEHRFLTADGWTCLSDLKINEYIETPRHLSYFNQDMKLNHEDQTVLNDICMFLGYMIGNGCFLKNHSVTFTDDNLTSINHVVALTKSLFGFEPKVEHYRNWYVVYLTNHGNNPVIELFNYLDIYNKRSRIKHLPDMVFSLNQEATRHLLRTLWITDGMISNKRKLAIGYSSSSIRLIKQIQMLLLKFGIISKIRGPVKCNYNLEVTHGFQVNFLNEIGSMDESKQTLALLKHKDIRIREQCDVIPAVALRKYGKRFKQANVGRPRLQQLDIPTFRELANSDIYWDKVKSITPLGIEETFDITVDDTHNFIANGIIAKNSVEQDSDIAMFTKSTEYPVATGAGKRYGITFDIKKNRSGKRGPLPEVDIYPAIHTIEDTSIAKRAKGRTNVTAAT